LEAFMSTPAVPVEFYRYRFLLGALQRINLISTVRLWCIPAEVQRLDAITQAWAAASARMTQFAQAEPGEPDAVSIVDPPAELHTRLAEISSDRLFRASFSALPTSFRFVEIDKLVAPQRDVNLDYVEDLRARIPGNTPQQLLEFCVGPRSTPPEWKILQTAQNQLVVTSKSLDLRFLGGYRKELSEQDIAVAHGGGQPVEVISLLIGYGAAPINVFQVGTRLILGNGFHRVVAMRAEGITRIPVVVQHVAQPEIEFPDQYLGLTRAYLVEDPRPVMIKDFFDDALTIELRLAPRRKTLKISWVTEESVIPV
jgi:hypothetical protein